MIEKLKSALAALEGTIPRLSPYGEQDWLDAKKAITDLRSVIAEMEAAEPVANVRTFTNGAGRREQRVVVIGDVNDGDLLYTHPQPKAEPPKCVKCGDELMSSFTSTCYACNQKAK